jgi:hypothetical protein
VTLDSTALVGPDVAYCAEIGYTDGRALCPVRIEGDPERQSCEAWAVGKARDTGRSGPTWTLEGQFCLGLAVNGCENHPDNQYALFAAKGGTYVHVRRERRLRPGLRGSLRTLRARARRPFAGTPWVSDCTGGIAPYSQYPILVHRWPLGHPNMRPT